MQRFDSARLYLYRVLPWSPIGDAHVFINIMWTIHGAGYSKPGWRGKPCQSIEECIKTIQWVQRSPEVKDIYVCMSSQREYELRTGNNGQFKVAVRSQQNAHQLRTLYADVDVKEGAYKTTEDALVAFADFLKRSGLPRPTLFVASGSGGFHCYWTMDKALSIAEWQPLANALSEALRRHGVKADTACTVDSARVLRIPETYNAKVNKLVVLGVNNMLPYDYTVDQMRSALAPYMGAQVIPLTPKGKIEGANAELAGGIETPKAPLINIQTVADAGCGFIREALANGGVDYGNPLWNLTTLVSVFTEGGREDAHRMAQGHATYTREDTDSLFDRKTTEKEVKNLGWPSCQSIEHAGCTSCPTCPLKGAGTRPLQFGRPTPPQQDDLGPLPFGYSRNPQGLIMLAKKGDNEGTVVQVQAAPYPIKDAWVQDEPWTLHFSMQNRGKDYSSINVSTEDANSPDRFRRVMGKQGIPLNDNMAKLFRDFVVAWQTLLQKTKENIVTSAPYGWVYDKDQLVGFAYGGRVWGKTGSRPAGMAHEEVARQYKAQGDLAIWKEAARLVTDMKSDSHNAILALAFAGPLVEFTGQEGLLISTYSVGSGYGKTTTMKVAQSVWGRPAIAMSGLTDTVKSTFSKAAALKNIPLFWDELKTEEDKRRFVEIAFQLSKGSENSRANVDGSLRRKGEWKTLIGSASNNSIVDAVSQVEKSTTAGVYRVFEYSMQPISGAVSAGRAEQIVHRTMRHFGQAGLVYAQFIGANHETIHEELVKVREALAAKLVIRYDERFWVWSVACLYMGALYATKLGLVDIDCKSLLKFLVQQFSAMRERLLGVHVDLSSKKTTTGVFGAYLNDMRAHNTVVTNIIWRQKGRPSANVVKQLNDTSRVNGLHVHIAADEELVRFTQWSFRDWLQKHGYAVTAVEKYLKENFGMKEGFARLGSGTDLKTLQQHVFEVPLPHTE